MTQKQLKEQYDAGQGVTSILLLLQTEVTNGNLNSAYKILKGWDNETLKRQTKRKKIPAVG